MRARNPGRVAVLLVFTFAFTVVGRTADASGCPASPADGTQVVEAVRTLFAAAAADDLGRFHSVVAADFYAFDGGKRFDGDALMNLIKALHAEGNTYVWTINEPEVHVSCSLAWVTYVNRGAVQNASGTQSRAWLESAVLQKESDRWRIRFFHSTRVP